MTGASQSANYTICHKVGKKIFGIKKYGKKTNKNKTQKQNIVKEKKDNSS